MTTTLPALSPAAYRLLYDAPHHEPSRYGGTLVPPPETRLAVLDELYRAGMVYSDRFEHGRLLIGVTQRGEAYLKHQREWLVVPRVKMGFSHRLPR